MDESGVRAVSEAFGKLFREVHETFRGQVRDLDPGTLNWRPLPKANSIAVLVTHTLGSQREMIRAVRSIPSERDRDAEFKAEADAARLLEMIDESDRDLAEMIAALTPADLTGMRPRGDRPPRSGIEWLISNYGHSREHIAQIDLTKQLYDSRT
jgi:hypothetical protein